MHVDIFVSLHSGHLIVSCVSIAALILTLELGNFADFTQLQIPNAQTKYYEILTTITETPHNTIRKITNWCIAFKYHLLTLQNKSDYFCTMVYGHIHTFIQIWIYINCNSVVLPHNMVSYAVFFYYFCIKRLCYTKIPLYLHCMWINVRRKYCQSWP